MIKKTAMFGLMIDTQRDFDDARVPYDEWLSAALADGWDAQPIYDSEGSDTAAKISGHGYTAHLMRRPPKNGLRGNLNLTIWGIDKLAVEPTFPYSRTEMDRSQRRCQYCRQENVDTQRVGFVGRCCAECLPEQRRRQEQPGWCD